MDIEIIQNVILIGMGVLIVFMYISAKAWDEVSDEMGEQYNSK